MDFPSRSDLFRVARDEVLSRSQLLSAEAVERDGTDANVLLAAGSAMADAVVGQLIRVCAAQFLDGAEDEVLDRHVFDRYGLTRKPAAAAVGRARFTLPTVASSSFTIPAGVILQTTAGTQFLTAVDTTFPAGSAGPVYVTIRSLLAGADQQVKAGEVTSIVSAIAGAPSGLAVTNTTATAGASDRETDDALRDRARRFWTTSRRGTLAAIEAGALAVPGVLRATALEAVDAVGRPNRWVYLVVTDRYTDALATLNATSPTYELQSQALATQVFNALSDVRCGGIFVEVVVAQVSLLQIRLDLTFSAGVDLDEVTRRAQARVASHVNELSPGETFSRAAALSALREVNGLLITGSEIASPVGDVVPKVVQVLRTTPSLVVATTGGGPVPVTTDPDTLIQVT